MPRFFAETEQIGPDIVILTGDDAHHISRALRMAAGERIIVCDGQGTDLLCELSAFLPDRVEAKILKRYPSETEPPYRAVLYQGLPKSDKFDTIIQKAVECGVWSVIPFESERCVVRLREEDQAKKTVRRNRIAQEAAKQCGRGIVPQVKEGTSFREALRQAATADLGLFCYEGEKTRSLAGVLRDAAPVLKRKDRPVISVMVGSEGGFSEAEAEQAAEAGMIPVGLGPRILRTETVAAVVLGCLSFSLEQS
jgi:16S rRNA (uracil1498-N3)-methyltransferase